MTPNLYRRLLFYTEKASDWWLRRAYRDRPYLEYYRAVMKREARKDPTYAVGGRWVRGRGQLQRLIMHGLKPEHRLFDLGCGSLRGGLHFIRYLDADNYTGNDISKEILEVGRKFLREEGLLDKRPRLLHTNSLDFREVAGETFDYIHAQSVLSHMPPEDIEALFRNVSGIMHPQTQFFASFLPATGNGIYPSNQRRNFHYPFLWMQETGAAHGLTVTLTKDLPGVTGKQPLLRIVLTDDR